MPDISLEAIGLLLALGGAGVGAWKWDKPRRDAARLENYLRERRLGYQQGRYPNFRQTEIHLKGELGLSPDEILQASNRSSKINRVITQHQSGMAKDVLYEYQD